MSDTPRTDAVVNKLQCEEVPFADAYAKMREFAGIHYVHDQTEMAFEYLKRIRDEAVSETK